MSSIGPVLPPGIINTSNGYLSASSRNISGATRGPFSLLTEQASPELYLSLYFVCDKKNFEWIGRRALVVGADETRNCERFSKTPDVDRFNPS